MRIFLIGLAVIASASAAHAQAPGFAELEGATIHASRTEVRSVRTSTDQNGEQRVVMVNTIRIGAGGKLTPSLTITADGVSSKSTSATRTFGGNTVSLNQPYAARDGQMVWVFESGTLTNMSTQSQGGHIMKIAFSRGSGGLTCRISGAFARENGAGAISLGSTTHSKGAVEVISVRQAGSSCRVSK